MGWQPTLLIEHDMNHITQHPHDTHWNPAMRSHPSPTLAAQKSVKCTSEVWVEYVVYDRVDDGATVGQPLEGHDHLR